MRSKLVAVNAVVVRIPEINLESGLVFGDGTTLEAKAEQLNHFPVLQLMGKRLSSFISNFRLKKYSLKDIIYKNGEQPKSVYFVIKGEVCFELILEGIEGSHSQVLPTETVAMHNFFGEEEIIFKSERVQTAKVIGSPCVVLELNRDKFEKML